MKNSLDIKQLLLDFPSLLKSVQIIKNCPLKGIGTLNSLKENDILFCPSAKEVYEASQKKLGLVITTQITAKEIEIKNYKNLNIIESPSLQESMAKIGTKYFSINNTNFNSSELCNIHPTAIIDSTAQLHPSAVVGAYSIIEANAVLGENVHIGTHSIVSNNSCVGAFTKIGSQVFVGNFVKIGKSNQIGQQVCIEHHSEIKNFNTLHSKVFIGRGSIIHSSCEIESNTSIGSDGYGYGTSLEGAHYKKVHFGNAVIKSNVQIGSSVTIDRGTFGHTLIDEGTKIDNLCHIAHNVNIGKHCLITAGFACAGSTTIGDHCIFGGQTAIAGHLNITHNVQIVGRSVVSSNVSKPGTYGGFPLQELKKFRRTYASLIKLPDLIKKVNKLLS